MRWKGNLGSRSQARRSTIVSLELRPGFRWNDSRGIPPGRDTPTNGTSGHACLSHALKETEEKGISLQSGLFGPPNDGASFQIWRERPLRPSCQLPC